MCLARWVSERSVGLVLTMGSPSPSDPVHQHLDVGRFGLRIRKRVWTLKMGHLELGIVRVEDFLQRQRQVGVVGLVPIVAHDDLEGGLRGPLCADKGALDVTEVITPIARCSAKTSTLSEADRESSDPQT